MIRPIWYAPWCETSRLSHSDMSSPRDTFRLFLTELGISDPGAVTRRFDEYLSLLEEFNRQVNLVSRNTPLSDYWTKHFLDSLMILKCIDFSGAKVLDFGSGGGFPGLPIKLAGANCAMTLLDSIGKKAAILRELVQKLEIPDCDVACSRLEDFKPSGGKGFSVILCRAVRMEERYCPHLARLLAPGGKVIFYKSATHEDIDAYATETLLEEETPWGKRLILSISREGLTR